jgi:uncharacterized repeat protein (TIGR01451 family)
MTGFITQVRFRQALVLSYLLIVWLLLLPMPNAFSLLNDSSQACIPSYVRHRANQGSKSTQTGTDSIHPTDAAGQMEFPSHSMHPFQVLSTEGYARRTSSVPSLYPDSDVVCPNGGFESGDFSCWAVGGNLPSHVQSKVKLEGNHAAMLGDPDPAKCRGGLPIGKAWISQTFQIPACGDPVLSFSYRIFSYDEHSESFSKLYDTFDVRIDDLSDDEPPFLVLRDGGNEPYGCDLDPYDSGWMQETRSLSSVAEQDTDQTHDLRGKEITVYFYNYSRDPGYDNAWYNTWVYIDNVEIEYPPLMLKKSADPAGPVHEGDLIAYTLAYTNTSPITQTITITDQLPFNLTVEPGTIQPADKGRLEGSTVVWDLGDILSCTSSQVSFKARVALLPSLHQEEVSAACPPDNPPDYVVPAEVYCETTRFWAHGVTIQPPVTDLYTFQVQIPSGSSPTAMWLLMKGTDNSPPVVEGQPAHLLATSNNVFGASVWTATITSTMIEDGEVTVRTHNSRELNAFFLFNADDPPFDLAALDDFQNTTKTFTYTLDIPSVTTQTIDVLLPFMDITSLRDDAPLPDTRITEVSVEFDGQEQSLRANRPNLGNGLLMTTFRFAISPFTDTYTTKTLTVTVNTEDSIYTLGPRVCRPVYIKNTAWLCSLQAGCISDTVVNIPEDFMPYGASGGIYLPLILKAHP